MTGARAKSGAKSAYVIDEDRRGGNGVRDRTLRATSHSAAFMFAELATDRYQSKISAPFQCSTPSKRFT
jgi:hypothetical protein